MKRTRRKAPGKHKDMSHRQAADILVKRAYASLKASGIAIGGSTKPIRVVVDMAILNAAKDRTGIVDNAALMNAALAALAATDDFGPYLIAQAGRLSVDFELAV